MRKKLFTLLLAFVASIGIMFASTKIGDLYYNLGATNHTAEVASNNSASGDIVIPASVTYNSVTYSVTSIGDVAFYDCSGLTSVTIPNSVTSIGKYAFYKCIGLVSVTIGNSVTRIGECAFANCTGLTSVTIPESVTSIGESAFYNCSGLASVTIGNSVTRIGENAFANCTGLTSVTIPESVTSIGEYAFWGCIGLTSVAIPNSVTSIEKSAFWGCIGLTSVTIPNSVTSIGESAFYNVLNIVYNGAATDSPWGAKSVNGYVDGFLVYSDASKTTLLACSAAAIGVTIPNSVTSIGESAFENCSGLTSVTIPNSVTSIGNFAFANCSGLTSVTIGNSVTSIGEYAFYGCSGLTSVTIPNSVTRIKGGAFYKCTGLTSVTIPNSVTSIEKSAFWGCIGLTSVTIPNSVTSIGESAFYNCSGLASVTIGNSVTSIGEWAFFGCTALTSVTIPNSVTSIGEYAFNNCSGLASVTIGNSVTSIGKYAFCKCIGLASVTIGNSVTRIGEYAFANCTALTSVTIPESVTSIGEYAFYGCSGLTSVTIPNSVTRIGNWAFGDCTSLPVINHIRYADTYLVEAVNKTLSTYTIREGTKWIGNEAFSGCTDLTAITIPSSVTGIGDRAFSGCSKFKLVTLEATLPPYIYSTSFPGNLIVYVPLGTLEAYKKTTWKNYTIHVIDPSHATTTTAATSAKITLGNTDEAKHISSCGMEGGEEFAGNVIEYIGLEPNSEYANIPLFIKTKEGDMDNTTVSFTTPALELTTKPSKPVSSNTAILLAETNMSDAEISCGFEWKRNDAPADMDGNKVYCPVASGQMAGRLKNLKDDVYYKYRAFYQSAAGKMYYGDWQYIFTGDVTVEFDPVLYTYGATVVHEKDATISGYALAGSEDFTEQGFEYWSESRANGGANAPHRMPAALGEHFFVQASGIALRVTLTNLDAGTVYKYRVYGKVGDLYYYGAEQSFTTQGEYEGDDSEAIDEVPSDQVPSAKALKVLRNGQIFILRGDKAYTLIGQEVK